MYSNNKLLSLGKQVFNLIISPDKSISLNVRCKNKQYTFKEDLCHKDGFVVIRVSLIVISIFPYCFFVYLLISSCSVSICKHCSQIAKITNSQDKQ